MNFKKINIVLGREFSIRVKKKSFILTTIITPILFACLMIIPSVIMMNDKGDEVRKVLVVDESGIVASTLEDTETVDFEVSQNTDVDALKKSFASLDVYALMVISPMDSSKNFSVTAYSEKQMNMDLKQTIKRSAKNALESYKLALYNIENLDTILADIQSDVKVDTFTIGQDGTEKKSIVEISMGLSYLMSFLIYFFVLMFGNMVMRSVIDEKSNRIVEVIVSSVKPFELMIGKILGVACVAVVQFLIWIVLTLVLVMGFQMVSGKDMAADAATEQVAQLAGADAGLISQVANSDEASGVFSALSQIDFTYIIGCFFVYFVLGYLLYAAMFAAVGSAVDNEADTQQLVMPVTAPLIIGLFIMLHTFQHPDSALSFWASIIPYTSPMVMLARIPFEGGVPAWQLALSIGLLFLTFLVTVYISAKIYRVGILMYGKKASFKDLWKWIKY